MATKNYVDKTTPAIDAEWLNEVDYLTHNLFATVDGTGATASSGVDIGGAEATATSSTTARTLAVRWSDYINVLDYGAALDGSTDDTAAWQAAIAQSLVDGRDIVQPYGDSLVSSTLDWYVDVFSIIGLADAKVTGSSISGPVFLATSGAAFGASPTSTYGPLAHRHKIQGLEIVSASGQPCVRFADSADYAAYGILENCSFGGGWGADVRDNAWGHLIRNCYAYGERLLVVESGYTNNGAKILIVGGACPTSQECIRIEEGDVDLHAVGLTFAQPAEDMVVMTAGHCTLSQCHMETVTDATYLFDISGFGTSLYLKDCKIIVGAARSTNEIFRAVSITGEGGIHLDGLQMALGTPAQSFYQLKRLVKTDEDNTAQITARNLNQPGNVVQPVVATELNLFADGGFDNGDIAEWDSSGLEDATYDGTTGNTANGSIKINRAATTGNTGMQIDFPMEPGQRYRLKFFYKTSGLVAAGKTLNVNHKYLDRQGTQISTANILNTTSEAAAFTEVLSDTLQIAPPGTRTLRLSLFGSDWTTSVSAWFDDFELNIN